MSTVSTKSGNRKQNVMLCLLTVLRLPSVPAFNIFGWFYYAAFFVILAVRQFFLTLLYGVAASFCCVAFLVCCFVWYLCSVFIKRQLCLGFCGVLLVVFAVLFLPCFTALQFRRQLIPLVGLYCVSSCFYCTVFLLASIVVRFCYSVCNY